MGSRITFKITTGHYLQLLIPETMKYPKELKVR